MFHGKIGKVLDLYLLDDHLLLQDLDGVQAVGSLLAAQDHFAEGALAEHFEELKVVQCLRWEKRE